LLPSQAVPEQAFSGPSADALTCEARFLVSGTGGRTGGEPVAVGHCQHWTGAPGSLDLVWGAARRFTLFPEIAGPDVAGSLDRLIEQWRDHLATVPEADSEDTAAIVNWPSRDIDGLNVMLKHGLTPLNVVAARPFARRGADFAAPARNQTGQTGQTGRTGRIRRARQSDLDAIAQFSLAEIRYDAHFGGVIERPEAEAAMRGYLANLLAEPEPEPEPWVWVAEAETADDLLLGVLAAERPHTARWIAPLTARSPVAYLMTAFVPPSARGTGVGTDLVREFHAEADAAGVHITLLHYELFNPRSGPFWSQQTYRPLWTALEARPAHRLR